MTGKMQKRAIRSALATHTPEFNALSAPHSRPGYIGVKKGLAQFRPRNPDIPRRLDLDKQGYRCINPRKG